MAEAEIQKIMGYVRRALDGYDMIADGDRIAVGISGGKDSLAMLVSLAEMRRYYSAKYEIVAVTIDMGFADTDYSAVAELCERLNVEYHIVKTQIFEIIFNIRKEKNPCSLCARMRRGALHDAAKEFGCNKVALGHHFDDVVETFMLNLFYEARIGAFRPVTYLSRKDLYVIRPLIFAPESAVAHFAKTISLPVVKSKCPADKDSERLRMKELLRELEHEHHDLREKIFGAIQRGHIDGF